MTTYTVVAYRDNRLSDYGYDAHNSDHDIEVFSTPEGAAERIAKMQFNDKTGQSMPHCNRFNEWEITLLIDGVPEDHFPDTQEEQDLLEACIKEVAKLTKKRLNELMAERKAQQRQEREAKRLQKQREDAKKAARKTAGELAEYERLKEKFG